MLTPRFHRLTQGLLLLVLVTLMPVLAMAQENPPTTPELEKALRATQREFKDFKSLRSKLESAGKQSSNASRSSSVQNFQEFMVECIFRRERELGEDITLKQHEGTVKSGTTEVAELGAPVPTRKRSKGSNLAGTLNGARLNQLSSMKGLAIAAKNIQQPAIERQNDSFDRYLANADKFGSQLEWGLNALTSELDRRADEEKAEAEKKAAALEDPTEEN